MPWHGGGATVRRAALAEGRLLAGLDVYDREPLPPGHVSRSAPNTVLTPHLGYVTEHNMAGLYRLSIENVLALLDGKPIRGKPIRGKPIRVVNPEVLAGGA